MNGEQSKKQTPHVVILGGGFGGLKAAQQLAQAQCRVTLIDRSNHHLFQPLLYQVATAGLAAPDIAFPLRRLFRGNDRVEVSKETVIHIDLGDQVVQTDERAICYDYLVIALGVRTSYFGNDHWADHTLGLKTLHDGVEIRHRFLESFEQAETATESHERDRLLTTVIVGGGPTGVELAGAFAEIKRHDLKGSFRSFDPDTARILLVEAGDRLLPTYSEDQSAYAKRKLEEMGVEVHVGTRVEDVAPNSVTLDGRNEKVATIVWAAGVEAPSLTRQLGVPTDRRGRLLVEPDLSLPGHPEAFAIGDLASLTDANGVVVPGVAPAATQMGAFVARVIKGRTGLSRHTPDPFRYVNKGDMATIGKQAAVASIRGWKSQGVLAWLLWLMVHVLFLVGIRNRLTVLINWAFAYLAPNRGAQIIVDSEGLAKDERPVERHKDVPLETVSAD